ncbi:prolipoprotein diacylglyceryl transferase [Streptococcus halotolerans]|uniref:prolipoprotein diacylglyceryl transferase n=1 Tax=Streptococcus halotolerans TaxID=1814128 RepID=UPI000788E492|nr:prolipoprotein diacylglyceryl transferase [Streptococcus halotolerans]
MIDPTALLGPFEIRWYALCIITGVMLAVYLAMKEAPRKKINPDSVLDFILLAFPIAIIGARFYYVIFEWSYYKNHLSEVFAIWNGGIAIYGGLIAGALVLYFFTRHQLIDTVDFLDIAAPGVLIAQSLGRWGNFFNQEAFGKSVPHLNYLPEVVRNQMYIDGAYRTPTFLYESLWNLLGFIIIISLRHKPKLLKKGEPSLFYLVWYGCGRFVIEAMRTDSLMLAGLRVSQWLSALLVIVGLGLWIYRRRHVDIPFYLKNVNK